MYRTKLIRLAAVSAAALALGGAAAGTADAAQNQGGGTQGDSDYCKSLLDRVKRFNDIANDPSQPAKVRQFYKNQAAVAVIHGQENKCSWAPAAIVRNPGSLGTANGTLSRAQAPSGAPTSRAARQKRAFAATKAPARVKGGAVFVKATTTGNQNLDDYCRQVADMIDNAFSEGDRETGNGNSEAAEWWYEFAGYMIDRATQNGCRFMMLKVGQVTHIQITQKATASPVRR